MLNRGAASAVPAGAISEALQLHTWTLTIGLAQARKAFGAGCRPVLPSVQAHYTTLIGAPTYHQVLSKLWHTSSTTQSTNGKITSFTWCSTA